MALFPKKVLKSSTPVAVALRPGDIDIHRPDFAEHLARMQRSMSQFDSNWESVQVAPRPLPELPKLVRTETAPVPDGDALSRDLATDAASLLGYGVGAVQIKRDDLLRQFKAMDITPLDTATVEVYKTAQAERMRRENAGRMFSWTITPIEQYKEKIPEFVLHTAVLIKRAIPEATFEVHHLRETKMDPFLAVILAGAGYYLEVWDEPSFKEERKW